MSDFDDVRTKKNGRSKGCPRCGAEKNLGVVQVALRELGAHGQIQGSVTVSTKSRSFCEPCSVEVYQQLVEVLTFDGAQVPA